MATGARALAKSEPQKPKTVPAEGANESTALPRAERIRQRAYEIYLQRGGQDGSELDDWLQAEQEISAEPTTSR